MKPCACGGGKCEGCRYAETLVLSMRYLGTSVTPPGVRAPEEDA